jgi:hypothetical protein
LSSTWTTTTTAVVVSRSLPSTWTTTAGKVPRGAARRDVEYEDFGLVVELDGRIGHEAIADRWDDMERDRLVSVDEKLSIRARGAGDRPG